MDELFITLTRAATGAVTDVWWIGMGAAFIWGLLSVVLSPCHLASIPLIVGYLNEQGELKTSRACWLSTVFSSGILATIAGIGALTALLGGMVGDIGSWGGYLVGFVFLVVGLHFLDVIGNPFRGANVSGVKKRGVLGALVLGLVFGIALGPCTFGYLWPIMAAAFKIASRSLLHALMLPLLFGAGHCLVIIFAGTFSEIIQHYLHWHERSRGAVWLKKICGVLVIAAGLYTIWKS